MLMCITDLVLTCFLMRRRPPSLQRTDKLFPYTTLLRSIAGETGSDELRKELIACVRKEIGPIATPDYLQWAPGLPKTRSGKIMRRILRGDRDRKSTRMNSSH